MPTTAILWYPRGDEIMSAQSNSRMNQEKRSCLAVVEADGLFDGRRRVRLPLRSSSSPFDDNRFETNGNEEKNNELLGLKKMLVEALELPSTTNAPGMEIELYDPTNESFRRLEKITDIPPICCRLRITPQPTESHSNNENQELLALPWREFSSSIDLDGKLVLKGGKHSITINEVSNSGLGTGTNIWDGAIALVKFLEFHDEEKRHGRNDPAKTGTHTHTDTHADTHTYTDADREQKNYSVRGKRILELGAGTGLVGIAAHIAFGAREVYLTDLEYSLDNLRDNLKANACEVASDAAAATTAQPCTIDARVLDWFDLDTCDEALRWRPGTTNARAETNAKDGQPASTATTGWSPDIILAADVVWVESLVCPLVQTLHHICTRAFSPPLILLSYQRRSQTVEDLLFRTMEEFSFRTEDVTSPVVATTSGAESKIRIYRITHTTPRGSKLKEAGRSRSNR